MSEKTCATCRWKGDPTVPGEEIVPCKNPRNEVDPTTNPYCNVYCFVRDDLSCPRWERKEDLADRVARRVADYLRDCRTQEEDTMRALAEVIRPMLQEEEP